MTKQNLISTYNDIEKQRRELKKRWTHLKKYGGDKEEIKELGQKLTSLTFNQCWILVDLENYRP